MKTDKKTSWWNRITYRQAILITWVYFIALGCVMLYADRTFSPVTGTLRTVYTGTNGRSTTIRYTIVPERSI